jgi:hypothetical protein
MYFVLERSDLMKRPDPLSACMVLIVVVLFAAGCTSASPGSTKDTSPVTPAVTPGQSSCGFTTCHGLDLACGTNAPEVCDMSYRVGDKCRQYARCDSSGGSCTLVTSPEFDSCKSCVERCEAIKSETVDPAMVFECEAKC